MAPSRKRQRKFTLGDARMEIAVERLTKDLGFDEKIVRKVAKQFLKEYDVGDASWPLIEEKNYEVLVEGVLEYQKSNDLEGSSAAEKDVSMVLEDEAPHEQVLVIPEESPFLPEETPPLAISTPAVNTADKQQDNTAGVDEDPDNTRFTLPSPVSDKAAVIRPCTRRPCYGWINNDDASDDDEPQEILELTPTGEIARVFTVGKTDENLSKRSSSGT